MSDQRVYVAQIYVPGYMPESDTPGFATASEAWSYLASERERGEEDAEPWEDMAGTVDRLRQLSTPSVDYRAIGASPSGSGYVMADAPGYSGDHDLGLVYRVSAVRHADYPHLPGYLIDCRACQAMCHCEPGSAECVYEGDHSE